MLFKMTSILVLKFMQLLIINIDCDSGNIFATLVFLVLTNVDIIYVKVLEQRANQFFFVLRMPQYINLIRVNFFHFN